MALAPRRLLMLAAAACLAGCPPPRTPPGPSVSPPHPDSLRAAWAAAEAPEGLQGRGSLRLQHAERVLPVLNLRFAVRPEGEARALLRPGLLAPVLSLWAGTGGWSVHLPRERAAFVADEEGSGGAAVPAVSGAQLARLGWILLRPGALFDHLERPRVFDQGEYWILSGRARDLGGEVAGLEIWILAEEMGIARWSLRTTTGETLLQVVYHPPVARHPGVLEPQTHLEFSAPGLQLTGTIRFTGIASKPFETVPRPVLPAGWQVLPGEEMPRVLQRVLQQEP